MGFTIKGLSFVKVVGARKTAQQSHMIFLFQLGDFHVNQPLVFLMVYMDDTATHEKLIGGAFLLRFFERWETIF